MDPVTFPQSNVVFAKDQPEYLPLPAFVQGSEVVTCWEASPGELAEIMRTGRVWLRVITFGHPLQPVQVLAEPPFVILPG